MICKVAMLAALCALCALAAIALASPASAATYIRSGSTTSPVYSGNFSAAQSGTSTLLATDGSSTVVSCSTGLLKGSFGGSGGASVSGTLTGFTLGPGCVGNSLPGLDTCSLDTAAGLTVTAGGTLAIGSMADTCYTNGGVAFCTLTRSTAVNSTVGNSDNSVTFSNINFFNTNFGCSTTWNFSGKFAPLQADDGSHATLYVTTT